MAQVSSQLRAAKTSRARVMMKKGYEDSDCRTSGWIFGRKTAERWKDEG